MTSTTIDKEAPLLEQKRVERKIAAPYRGDFAWRIVFEAAWGFALWSAMIVLATKGVVPYWTACLVNSWVAYLMYMPLHEATHGNISGRHGNLRWVDNLIGSISAIPMWFSYKAHVPSHMHHHAYTNDPARDPDHFIAGPFTHLFGKHLRYSIVQLILPLLVVFGNEPKRIDNWLFRGIGEVLPTPDEVRVQTRFLITCLVVFVGLGAAGFFWEALLLWYVPARIGFFVVMTLFAWLPHFPHVERGRYRDTRVTLFPFGTAICRGHNHHVLHHMFPRVPHYKLRSLFREMRPILEEHDVRIEGPLAGPGAPKMMLRWNSPEPASRRVGEL